MKPNRYIKAMEIGLAHEEEGISYNDLKVEIEKYLGERFGENSESTFVYWFMDNFTYRNGKYDPSDFRGLWLGYLEYKNGDKSKLNYAITIDGYLVNKFFLDGHAAKQYLDYQEYKAARKSSFWATVLASVSILIAAGSFWFTYNTAKETPKPPFEVKIIENKSRAEQLEKENSQLKDELYKAEMMLEAYESDSTKVGL